MGTCCSALVDVPDRVALSGSVLARLRQTQLMCAGPRRRQELRGKMGCMSFTWALILLLAEAPTDARSTHRTAGASTPPRVPAAAAPRADPASLVPDGQLTQQMGTGELVLGRFRLKPDKQGGYDSETERFTAHIAADGAVTFRERKRLPGPAVWPVLVAAQILKDATNRPAGGVPVSGAGGKALAYQVQKPTLTLGDDDLYRDSYHAQKMTFLDATASLRKQLQDIHQAASLARFRKHIDAQATDQSRPEAERRRLLFEQWAESEGAAARATVESVARECFPAGGPHAYTLEELATMNRSRPPADRFDPYR